jgi:hypothetical protein
MTARSYEEWLELIVQKKAHLLNVPAEHHTYELCLTAVKNGGHLISQIPCEHRDYNLYYAAVCSYADVILIVPPILADYTMWQVAIKQNQSLLKHAPKALRGRELLEMQAIN